MTVQVIIANPHAHPRLLHPVVAQCRAAQDSLFTKRSIPVIHEKQAGCGIAGYIDVLPSIFIKIRRDHSHAVSGCRPGDAGLLCHVGEGSVAVVSIESMLAGSETPRAAFDGNPLPAAV